MEWNIGDITVTLIQEIEQKFDLYFQGLLPGADPAVIEANEDWLRPHFFDDHGYMTLSIHAFVLETRDKTILVDTCLGNDRILPGYDEISSLHTSFLSDLEAAGYSPDSIDIVFCTHLHFDHVGWNTRLVDNEWTPTFANARYLFGRVEYEYWNADNKGKDIIFNDAVKPVFEEGLAELVESDFSLTDEIWLESTPGHTPGHMSVRISSKGEEAVITGDVLHNPVQFVAPEWLMMGDHDPTQAAATRIAFRSRYGDKPVLIFGTHFSAPYAGFLMNSGLGWKFMPLQSS